MGVKKEKKRSLFLELLGRKIIGELLCYHNRLNNTKTTKLTHVLANY